MMPLQIGGMSHNALVETESNNVNEVKPRARSVFNLQLHMR